MTSNNGRIYEIENYCWRHHQRQGLQTLSKSNQKRGETWLKHQFQKWKGRHHMRGKTRDDAEGLNSNSKTSAAGKMHATNSKQEKHLGCPISIQELSLSWNLPTTNAHSSRLLWYISIKHLWGGKKPQTHPENKNRGNTSKFMRSA